jgi:hypothetical protein
MSIVSRALPWRALSTVSPEFTMRCKFLHLFLAPSVRTFIPEWVTVSYPDSPPVPDAGKNIGSTWKKLFLGTMCVHLPECFPSAKLMLYRLNRQTQCLGPQYIPTTHTEDSVLRLVHYRLFSCDVLLCSRHHVSHYQPKPH